MTTRIVLDALGGDRAPQETIKGAVLAAREYGVEVILVGLKDVVEAELAKQSPEATLSLPVVHASETIEMHEHPAMAVRAKKDSSMAVGLGLVAAGQADGFVTAGNSGAAMAAALFSLGRIRSVERPALGMAVPTAKGPALMIDIGANTDCKPAYLLQFAQMGAVYYQKVFGVERPAVGLLSTGEEETKGNQLVLETHPLLKKSQLNFIGNIEGKDIPAGCAHVVVCDGFVGNVALKLIEGMALVVFGMIRTEIERNLVSKLGALLARPSLRRVGTRLNYAEYGGAPLLGVNGVCIVAHGRSNAVAIKNAIRVAKQAAEQNIVGTIKEAIETGVIRAV